MGTIDFINQFPLWLGLLYLCIEGLKAYLPHRAKNKATEEKTRDEVTDAVFEMYGLAKKDVESDKLEIRELTKLLKKANLEITILERKIAALMRVMDSILMGRPDSHETFLEAMAKYQKEMGKLGDKVKNDDDLI